MDNKQRQQLRQRLAQAVRKARGKMTQTELGTRTSRSQGQISEVERGAIELTVVRMIEIEEATGRGVGWILRSMGYLGDLEGFAAQVEADPLLDGTGKAAVLATYQACVQHFAAQQGGG